MFGLIDVGLVALATIEDPATSSIDRLRATEKLARVADAARAETIAALAQENGWCGQGQPPELGVEGRRLVRVGAGGELLVDEALPLEVAVATGTTVNSAVLLLRDVTDLRLRFPKAWAAVTQCRMPLWQGRKITQLACAFDLDAAECSTVDARLAPMLGRIGYGRLINQTRAAIMSTAPTKVAAKAQQAADNRYVTRQETDHPGTALINARLDTADAIYLDATIDRLADILAEQGDQALKDHRRATALGILATPALALSMLGIHTRRGLDDDETMPIPTAAIAATALPAAQVYIHLGPDALNPQAGDTVARVERLGPILVSQLSHLLGHARIKLTPVIHLVGSPEPAVDAYEIPDTIRQQIILRDTYEAFPYSTRDARRLDVDHTIPYANGQTRQTRPSNLGPLSRRAHRAKTHCGWKLTQPTPAIFNWTTGLGQTFTLTAGTTTDTTNTS